MTIDCEDNGSQRKVLSLGVTLQSKARCHVRAPLIFIPIRSETVQHQGMSALRGHCLSEQRHQAFIESFRVAAELDKSVGLFAGSDSDLMERSDWLLKCLCNAAGSLDLVFPKPNFRRSFTRPHSCWLQHKSPTSMSPVMPRRNVFFGSSCSVGKASTVTR